MLVLASFVAASGSTATLQRFSPADAGFTPARRFVVRYEGTGWWAEEAFEDIGPAESEFNRAVAHQRAADAREAETR